MLKGKEKAAAILSILGEEISQKILSFLPEEAAVSVISASENLPTPTKEVLQDVIAEYNTYMSAQSQDAANKKVIKTGSPLEIISSASGQDLARVLKEERGEISAFVLSHLPVERIYEILPLLGESRQTIESRLMSIKDVPMAKELADKVLKAVSERLA